MRLILIITFLLTSLGGFTQITKSDFKKIFKRGETQLIAPHVTETVKLDVIALPAFMGHTTLPAESIPKILNSFITGTGKFAINVFNSENIEVTYQTNNRRTIFILELKDDKIYYITIIDKKYFDDI